MKIISSLCLILLISTLTMKGQSKPSTPSTKQGTSSLSDLEKWRFVTTYNRMLYERDIRYQVELQDSVKTEIIKEYEAQTGVSARSRDDLKQAFEMQGWVKDDLGLKLSEAEKDLKAMGRKKNFWKVATVVGIPVGIGFGAVVGTILTVKYIK